MDNVGVFALLNGRARLDLKKPVLVVASSTTAEDFCVKTENPPDQRVRVEMA
jgi:hypothetical protein